MKKNSKRETLIEVKLREVFILKNGERPSFSNKGKFPVYGANGIMGQTEKFLVNNDFTLIFGRVGASGEVHLAKGKIWVSDNAIYTERYDAMKIYPPFAFYFFKWKNLKQYATKTTHPIITQSFLNSLKIPLPPLPIQKKIAEILSTVDEGIEKTDKAILKAERIKKGLMERLFREGWRMREEGGGKRKLKRTEIGVIPEEWEVVRLGEVFDIRAGGDIYKLNFSKQKHGRFKFPIYSNTLENKGLYGYADTYQYPENCITVTGRGTLGRAIPRFEKFNAIIRLLVLIPKRNVDIVFVSEYINEKISFTLEKTSIPQLTAPKFAKYKIPLPPLPEQKKIAEILMTMDKKIEVLKKRKEKLERIKKGLMEELLTGRKDVE